MKTWRESFRDPGRRYARFLDRHALWAVAVVLSLTIMAVFISFHWLKKDQSTTALYDNQSLESQQYRRYTQEFGEPDDLIVVVSGGTSSQRRNFIQQLVYRLDLEPSEQIDSIFFQIPLSSFATMLYASDEELKELESALAAPENIFNRLLAAGNFEEIFLGLNRELKATLQVGHLDEDPEEGAQFFQGLKRFVLSLQQALQEEAAGSISWLGDWTEALQVPLGGVDGEGFLTTADGQYHLLFIKPGDTTANAKKSIALVQTVRGYLEDLRPRFPALEMGLTGGPALTHDEFAVSERDMILASAFALATTALIFILAFRSFIRPFLGFFCLVMGVAITFGWTTVTIGRLTLISLSFAVILIGLGTQYGIHIIARYEEERAAGHSIFETLATLMRETVPSLWIGALTTAAAFFATLLIDFRGFQELGFIAGSGILISFALMSFALPAFLALHDRILRPKVATRLQRSRERVAQASGGILGWLFAYPKAVIIGAGLFSLAALVFYAGWGPVPRFDYNLLNLQAENTEAVRYEKMLLETEISPRFAILLTESYAEMERLTEELKVLPHVGRVESLQTVLPVASPGKIAWVRTLATGLEERLGFGNRPSQAETLQEALVALEGTLTDIEEKLFAVGAVEALEAAAATTEQIKHFRDRLAGDKGTHYNARLNEIQEAVALDMRAWLNRERERETLTAEDLPTALRRRFTSDAGSYAIYVYPSESIWDREGLSNFVNSLRTYSKAFTGPPLQMFDVLNAMESGAYRAVFFAAILIFMLFLWDFRSFTWALIATTPLACGLSLIYGGMAFFEWRWNIVNLIALPLVLGIGADCGIHLIHRYREEKKGDLSYVLSSTGKAVTIAYADTITSFLGLAVATHQGLASLGQVIIWGIFCCYLAGIILLPALLATLRPRVERS